MNVTIVGGGVIGLCCAYYLQKEGHEITIIDKGDITSGTSFGNAGYISPSHFVPLASPGIVAKGLRWMLSSTSPFYIKPRLDARLAQWCFSFWRNANAKKAQASASHLLNILHLSRQLTSDIKEELGNHFRMEEKGCFMLYKSAQTEKHELALAEEAKALGLETRIMNAHQIQELEPGVEMDIRGGVLYPIDAHLHPGDFMKTLKDHLERKGVAFQFHTTVTRFEKEGNKVTSVITDKGRFDCAQLVLANGSWMGITAASLGIKLLLQAGKGYSMTYENIDRNLRYPAILIDRRVAMTPMGADLRLGGTMEISGLDSPLLIKRAEAIFRAAKEYYPGLSIQFPEKARIWSGLRPLTPDGLPYIGRTHNFTNLVMAGGHAMLGLSLAAGTGKLVAEVISGVRPSVQLDAFSPARFS